MIELIKKNIDEENKGVSNIAIPTEDSNQMSLSANGLDISAIPIENMSCTVLECDDTATVICSICSRRVCSYLHGESHERHAWLQFKDIQLADTNMVNEDINTNIKVINSIAPTISNTEISEVIDENNKSKALESNQIIPNKRMNKNRVKFQYDKIQSTQSLTNPLEITELKVDEVSKKRQSHHNVNEIFERPEKRIVIEENKIEGVYEKIKLLLVQQQFDEIHQYLWQYSSFDVDFLTLLAVKMGIKIPFHSKRITKTEFLSLLMNEMKAN